MKHTFLFFSLGALLGGCASKPLVEAAREPVPPPAPFHVPLPEQPEEVAPASLWTSAPNALLSMRRAKDVGDLLTVVVDMNDQANLGTTFLIEIPMHHPEVSISEKSDAP